MQGRLVFTEQVQAEQKVICVHFDGISCGLIIPYEDKEGAWYRWGKIQNYDTSVVGCKSWVIELFNQLDSFKYPIQ